MLQWIARSEADSSRNDIEEAYERGDSSHLPGHKVSLLIKLLDFALKSIKFEFKKAGIFEFINLRHAMHILSAF